MRITVAYNCDNEDDISSVDVAIGDALRELGHEVKEFPVVSFDSIEERIESIDADLIFNSFDGFDSNPESEILFAHYLEKSGIPFTGSSSYVLSLTLDKWRTNSILAMNGIKIPGGYIFGDSKIYRDFPYIVKPNRDDCSNFISLNSIVQNQKELKEYVSKMIYLGCSEILIEKYIEGREFTSSIINKNGKMKMLGISEIIFSETPHIRTFDSKQNDSFCFVNPKLAEEEYQDIEETSLWACYVMGCNDYARIDFRRDEEDLYLLEINANPDISAESSIMFHIKNRNMTFRDLIENIVVVAVNRINE